MCIQFRLGREDISQHEDFEPGNRVVISPTSMQMEGITIEKPVYWDGWARKEDLWEKWTKDGRWQRVDIYASHFCQMGRWYEVPSCQAIKAIGFDSGKRVVVKIITRSSEGKEGRVQDRFAVTGHTHIVPSKEWPK